MIVLTSGANTVDVVLLDKATLTSPYFVFMFMNDQTQEKFFVYNTYTTVQDYVQRFTITVQSSPTWTSGQVVLSKRGFYHYFVYETSDLGAINPTALALLSIAQIETYFTSLVKKGKMNFDATDLTVNTYRNSAEAVKAYGD